ncbi:MAG: A/G-specific adenine glycosylase [Planctomycetaceae bacterium]|nr:A/G-specific adenine glycosylase [Planctomycetaceae bacterium]
MTPVWLRSFRSRLRRWHAQHGRDLPWRGADAYRVWISEIMLQQTTVAAVIPYFERFLKAFPTVTALAAADEQQVLRLWEGLGYYSRARNLHRAARVIVSEHEGRLPKDVTALQKLPGVGRYTAGAIASFAYDRPAPIVEANTLRLYARLLAYDGDPRSSAGQQRLWQFAEEVLPTKQPGEFNQALMDLGATVCVPDEPRCEECPVMTLCGAFQSGRQCEIPIPKRRPELTDVTECAVVAQRRGKYLVRRCQPGERWAGLWDFPRFPVTTPEPGNQSKVRTTGQSSNVGATLARAASEGVRRLTGIEVAIQSQLREIRHGVTRYRIRLICLSGQWRSGTLSGSDDLLRWVSRDELQHLPLSTTGRKIAGTLAAD